MSCTWQDLPIKRVPKLLAMPTIHGLLNEDISNAGTGEGGQVPLRVRTAKSKQVSMYSRLTMLSNENENHGSSVLEPSEYSSLPHR